MNFNLTTVDNQAEGRLQIEKRIAYHQAGHAVAICLGNKQKLLPEVHFQILIKRHFDDHEGKPVLPFGRRLGNYRSEFQGGRLVQSLPMSLYEASKAMSKEEHKEYKRVFEADIINLLAGPLTEAKYIALRDDEIFSPNLLNVPALRFYGGNQALGLVSEYMDCFMLNQYDYEKKLQELYLLAYSFINKQANWRAITALAEHILHESATSLDCEDVMAFLDTHFEPYIKFYGISELNNLIELPLSA
jgi:hypothetical protein